MGTIIGVAKSDGWLIVTDSGSLLPGYPGVQHTLTTIRVRKGQSIEEGVAGFKRGRPFQEGGHCIGGRKDEGVDFREEDR
jgi:hypothetical protein